MSDSFLTYRNIVSRVFRLSMLIAAKRHESAADVFDGFLEELGAIVGSSANIRALDEFLERDPPSPCSPPCEEADAHIIPVRMVIHEEPAVHVEKIESPPLKENPVENPFVVVLETEKEVEETEETEETEDEIEVLEKDEEGGEVEETDEEVLEVVETKVEVEETEECEVEETDEEVLEVVETKVEETEEEVLEIEETEEEVEESDETEEEGSFEPIKIGKTMYFVDTTTQNVFAYISDEEAGDLVGKLVNGKLVKA